MLHNATKAERKAREAQLDGIWEGYDPTSCSNDDLIRRNQASEIRDPHALGNNNASGQGGG